MSKYYKLFAIVYTVGLLAITILHYVFSIKISSGVNAAVLIVTVFSVVDRFIKDTQRAPTKKEIRSLASGSFITSFIISLVAVMISAFLTNSISDIVSIFSKLSLAMAIVIFLIPTIIYYLLLLFLYWLLSKISVKQLKKVE